MPCKLVTETLTLHLTITLTLIRTTLGWCEDDDLMGLVQFPAQQRTTIRTRPSRGRCSSRRLGAPPRAARRAAGDDRINTRSRLTLRLYRCWDVVDTAPRREGCVPCAMSARRRAMFDSFVV